MDVTSGEQAAGPGSGGRTDITDSRGFQVGHGNLQVNFFSGGPPAAAADARRAMRLAARPPLLAGREKLLSELEARLGDGGGAAPRLAALCGLGGVGKTSAAVEYAYRHIGECGVVWQFAAENRPSLADGFSELAAQLGIRDAVNTADPVPQVHAALAARPGDWLLIFDNAPHRLAVQAALPPAGSGRVLITSQDSLWPASQAIEVPALGDEAALAFLVERADCAGQEDAARELAAELGGLPLALEQAGAYIRATGRGIDGYLSLFRRRRADLLARGEPEGYDKRVATSWSLSFDDLRRDSPEAITLLRLLANWAPEGIPLDRLLRPGAALRDALGQQLCAQIEPLLDDPLAADDAITALRRYSLVSAPRDGAVSVHRLVQAVTIAQLPADQAAAWRQAAGLLVEAALPDDPRLAAAWPACSALLPHAQACLDYGSPGLAKIAGYLGQSGSYQVARDLQSRIVAERERARGPQDADTLAGRANLADWTGQAGEAAKARDQHAELLEAYTRVLGPEDPQTLTERDNVARWTGKAGHPVAARDLYAALIPVRLRVSGPEHPDTLLAQARFARWSTESGDFTTARDRYTEVLPLMERVLGAAHWETIAARANLATTLGCVGDPAGARDQLIALLPTATEVFGPEHPYTLVQRSNIANFTGQAGDAARARDLFAQLLPVQERVCGREHSYTLSSREGLAHWTQQADDEQARPQQP